MPVPWSASAGTGGRIFGCAVLGGRAGVGVDVDLVGSGAGGWQAVTANAISSESLHPFEGVEPRPFIRR
jgi:hypothetical protein